MGSNGCPCSASRCTHMLKRGGGGTLNGSAMPRGGGRTSSGGGGCAFALPKAVSLTVLALAFKGRRGCGRRVYR